MPPHLSFSFSTALRVSFFVLFLVFLPTGCTDSQDGQSFFQTIWNRPNLYPTTIPNTYGTVFDCKIASKKYGAQNVWVGLISGRYTRYDRQRPISRQGCFPTQEECTAFLNVMDGSFNQVFTRSCTFGYQSSIF